MKHAGKMWISQVVASFLKRTFKFDSDEASSTLVMSLAFQGNKSKSQISATAMKQQDIQEN